MNKNELTKIFEAHTPNTEMSEEEMQMVLDIMISDNQGFNTVVEEMDVKSEIYRHFKPLIDCFTVQVFLKRLKSLTSLKLTLGALVMLSQQFHSLGQAVMMVYYLHIKSPENSTVTVESVTMNLFPRGYFSEEQWNQIWKSQKVRDNKITKELSCIGAYDNMIDYLETWK